MLFVTIHMKLYQNALCYTRVVTEKTPEKRDNQIQTRELDSGYSQFLKKMRGRAASWVNN